MGNINLSEVITIIVDNLTPKLNKLKELSEGLTEGCGKKINRIYTCGKKYLLRPSGFCQDCKKKHQELSNEQARMIKHDPSIFAYVVLKDPLDNTKPLKVYPWQDNFLNDKSNKKHVTIARQTGKTIAICIDILHKMTFADKDMTFLIFSKGERQAQDVLYKLRLLMRNAKFDYKKSLKVDSKSELYRKNQDGVTECRVISEVATPSALGHSPQDVYLDEFSYVENDQDFYEHIVLPMVAKTKGTITITSTPRDTESYFYKIYNENPYFTKYHFDYHACPDYDEKWAEERKNEMDIINYRSEVLAEFVSGRVNQYYPYDIVKPCVSDSIDSQYDSKKIYYAGVDWGQMKSTNVITIVSHIMIDEVTNDVEVVEIVARKETPYSAIMGELKELNKKYNLAAIYCDRGAGQGQIDILQESLGINIEPVAFTIQSKVSMNSNLKKLFEKKEIKIPNNQQLKDELISFEYTHTSSGQMKLHGSKSDDYVDSLALSCMGITESKPASGMFIPKKSRSPKDKKTHKIVVCEECLKEGGDGYYDIDPSEYEDGVPYKCPKHSTLPL